MKLHIIKACLILCFFAWQFCYATPTEVALTIDDLPVHGPLPKGVTRADIVNKMIAILKKHHIKGVYGFINGSNALDNQENRQSLQRWISAGHFLANHTYSHIDFDQVDESTFINNIQENEPLLSRLMGKKNYHYFRYPYLAEGNTQIKRNRVRNFLSSHRYQIAPVTVDFSDYAWNPAYARCMQIQDNEAIAWLKQSFVEQALNGLRIAHALSETLYGRDIKNILLIHVGAFDALMLDDLLTAYEKQGVKFISLRKALNDKAYKINPNLVRDRTFTFLNQMRLARHLLNPKIVDELYQALPEEKLNNLCR